MRSSRSTAELETEMVVTLWELNFAVRAGLAKSAGADAVRLARLAFEIQPQLRDERLFA